MVKFLMRELDLNKAIWEKKQVWAGLGPWAIVFRPVSDPKLGEGLAHSGRRVHVQTDELQCQNKGSHWRKPKVPGLYICTGAGRGWGAEPFLWPE